MNEHSESENDSVITSNSRVPLYFVYSVLATVLPLAIYGTFLWLNLKSEVSGKMSYYQFQQWQYDFKNLNPAIVLPRPINPGGAVGFYEPANLLNFGQITLK